MRTTKNSLFATVLLVCFSLVTSLAQQTHKVAMSSGRLVINNVNEITIEGYDGQEVVFEFINGQSEIPEKAKGLRAINGMGLKDNTNMGLSVLRKGNDLEVAAISKNSDIHYRIRVPKSVNIFYEHDTNRGEDLYLNNIQSEIEISTRYNDVFLENVTGPMAVKTVHGDIKAEFAQLSQKGSISLHSIHGDIDVSFPSTTKANFLLKSNYGEMYTDLDLKIDATADAKQSFSKNITGTLNGGGVDISLKTSHSNIYLRKK